MKKNNKGFTMLETLVTSTLIISTLVFLYSQFSNLKRSYDDSFQLNTVQGIHSAKVLAKYYLDHNDRICNGYTINPCQNDAFSEIYDVLNIDSSYIFLDSSTYIKNIEYDYCRDNQCKRFIRNSITDTNNPRLLVKFNDNTYATVLIK